MTTNATIPVPHEFQRRFIISEWSASASVIIGLTVLIGWFADIPALTSLLPGFTSIKVNPAVCFVLVGIALWMSQPKRITTRTRLISFVLSLLVLAISLLTLAQYVFKADFGIDQVLMHQPDALNPLFLGRMAPHAALCFMLIAVSLLMLDKRSARKILIVRVMNAFVLFVAAVAVVGYVSNISILFAYLNFSSLALHTALALIIVAIGIQFLLPEESTHTTRAEKQILAGFVIAMLFILCIGIVAVKSNSKLQASSNMVANTHEVLQNLEEVLSLVKDAETSSRGYVITGDTLFLQLFNPSKTKIPSALQALLQVTADNPTYRTFGVDLKLLINKKIEYIDTTINLRKEKGFQAAAERVESGTGKAIMDEIRNLVAEMKTAENALLKERLAKETKNANSANTIILTFIALQFGLMVFIYYILTRDIATRKSAENVLKKLNEDLDRRVIERTAQWEAANSELETFSYSVSHDLRAPLRHINGFIELLQKNKRVTLDEKSSRYLDIISSSAKQMGQLIDDLLRFSKVGRASLSITGIQLKDLVAKVQAELSFNVKNTITWKIKSLPVVHADPALLYLVLQNLIANAIKYSSKATMPAIEIGCGEMATASEIILYVKDNGAGFNMKYVGKLFGVFQRLHSNDDYEGTGIGLATVRRIIHKHAGRVWAEGEEGKGATFYFSLPVKNQ